MSFKVLVINPQDDARKYYSEIVKGQNYIVNVASSLEEGLDIVHTFLKGSLYKLIILDEVAISEEQLNQEVITKLFGETSLLLLLSNSKILSVLRWADPNIFVFLKPFGKESLQAKIVSVELWVRLKEKQKYLLLTKNEIGPMIQKNHLSLALDNHPDHIPMAIDYLLTLLENFGVGEDDLFRIKLGLTEGLINAVTHGNLDMNSLELKGKQKNFNHWDAEILRRSQAPEYQKKRVLLEMSYDAEGNVSLIIEDEGKGFNANMALNKKKNKEEMYDSFGRGLNMVKSTSDGMEYNDKGNRLILRYLTESPS